MKIVLVGFVAHPYHFSIEAVSKSGLEVNSVSLTCKIRHQKSASPNLRDDEVIDPFRVMLFVHPYRVIARVQNRRPNDFQPDLILRPRKTTLPQMLCWKIFPKTAVLRHVGTLSM
jgi:hypothetical protein